MNHYQKIKRSVPSIMRIGKTNLMDINVFDHSEKYNDKSEMLEEGKFFMGSDTKNTRCSKFTILGADKTHSEKKKEK